MSYREVHASWRPGRVGGVPRRLCDGQRTPPRQQGLEELCALCPFIGLPLPFHDLSLPILDRSLSFYDLSLPFTAYRDNVGWHPLPLTLPFVGKRLAAARVGHSASERLCFVCLWPRSKTGRCAPCTGRARGSVRCCGCARVARALEVRLHRLIHTKHPGWCNSMKFRGEGLAVRHPDTPKSGYTGSYKIHSAAEC